MSDAEQDRRYRDMGGALDLPKLAENSFVATEELRLSHPVSVCTPTMRLRWNAAGVLQQEWVDLWNGASEWRDVPRE